jgi:hypothetical protein
MCLSAKGFFEMKAIWVWQKSRIYNCACAVSYTIVPDQSWSPPKPTDPAYKYYEGVGWTDTPVAVVGGTDQTDACLVGANQDGTIVAFRGTLGLDPPTWAALYDWFMNDFAVLPRPVPEFGSGVKVHSGWWNSVNQIWTGLEKALSGMDTSRLVFTGHSKGGPMASLAAMKYFAAKQQAPTVYTYASPLPGNVEFASAYHDAGITQTRYENYLDIAPFFPPPLWLIDLIEKKDPNLGTLFKLLLDLAKDWDYSPVGKGEYIRENHSLKPMEPPSSQPTLLTDVRLLENLKIKGSKSTHNSYETS